MHVPISGNREKMKQNAPYNTSEASKEGARRGFMNEEYGRGATFEKSTSTTRKTYHPYLTYEKYKARKRNSPEPKLYVALYKQRKSKKCEPPIYDTMRLGAILYI